MRLAWGGPGDHAQVSTVKELTVKERPHKSPEGGVGDAMLGACRVTVQQGAQMELSPS